MDIAGKRAFIIRFTYFAVWFGLSIVLVRYALPVLMPFVIALVVALMLRPLVNVLNRRLRLPKKPTAFVLVLLFYGTIGAGAVFAGYGIINALVDFFARLPDWYNNQFGPFLQGKISEAVIFLNQLGESSGQTPDFSSVDLISALGEQINALSGRVISAASNWVLSVPGFLLKAVIAVVSTVFMAMDGELLIRFVLNQFSDKNQLLIRNIASHLGKVIRQYATSYALILLITFAEISVGLWLIGMQNAVWIAAVIALFDILPIVGSGMVLFPWAVVSLLQGSTWIGMELLILWAVVIVVRYIMEPKIVGNHVGLHPLLTLISMIAGSYLYGGIGILLLPVTLALCQRLNQEGVICLYRPMPPGEQKQPGRLRQALERLFSRRSHKK